MEVVYFSAVSLLVYQTVWLSNPENASLHWNGRNAMHAVVKEINTMFNTENF
jgi:hypothetical protein